MIDTENTQEVICPHCGAVAAYGAELRGDEGEIDCGACDKPMRYTRYIDITYTTEKVGGDGQ